MRVIIEAALLGIDFVHAAQHVVERFVIVGGVANGEVEQDAGDLALVVIRNAAVGLAVVVVFFEPGVEAGFFDALPGVRGARIEFADLAGEVAVELVFGPQSGAFESVGAVGAGDAFGEPERARIHFFGVVHGLERLRTDAFHVPGVKKFVRGYGGGAFDGGCCDGRAICVLHSSAAYFGIRPEMEEEGVLAERRAAHHLHFGLCDALQIGLQAVAVPAVAVHDHAEMRAGFVEGKLVEFADFGGSVNQFVVACGCE